MWRVACSASMREDLVRTKANTATPATLQRGGMSQPEHKHTILIVAGRGEGGEGRGGGG